MEMNEKQMITVETTVELPIDKVWEYWNSPEHICHWYHASDDWHTPHAVNDLSVGKEFVYRMEAKDGSMGFDFGGSYDEIVEKERIAITLGDDRKVFVTFTPEGSRTKITECFGAESMNSVEMQQYGWQCILNNFKKYSEETEK